MSGAGAENTNNVDADDDDDNNNNNNNITTSTKRTTTTTTTTTELVSISGTAIRLPTKRSHSRR
ncbi:hypothetical protein BO82DRAFT_397207 [Aspergillus uvarum CBS 121591]|uniref:Uncharacterized protein n=1 Tax=Aspergillus uvarum CBS 121591 TaxID=1448315 RepID=A0A319CY05_9EURO|nr:hypothetical protein BO82DRAFT_397207 [Aspergillus uvarum CBS 121591]PYH87297.1 hypothetical protein BO82DRAFT_397207 [Aspergillus uvarum CBS 121591]